MSQEIYLDANATSPVMPAAIDAALAAMRDGFGNPSSTHATGLRARAMLDGVRARARRVLGAPRGKVIFTSGATEAIQTAVLSALCALRARRAAGEAVGSLLVYGATEHKAVPYALAHWNAVLGTGFELRALPVDAEGRHRIDVLRDLLPQAAFVCTMAANNESGVVTDLAAIGAALDQAPQRPLWMVDCVQALGKLPLQLDDSRIDYAPFSGHKLYAPKGIGMLYVREGAPFTALCMGGGQEAGDRSGTENMAGIAALGAVLEALEDGAAFRTHSEMAAMRERLAAALRSAFPDIVFNVPFAHALPTTISFAVPSVSGKELLDLFDAAGVRVSAGSACSAASAAPSYVLQAMGADEWRTRASVRMSFGPLADDAFIDAACARIERCGQALRSAGIGGRTAPQLPLVTHLSAGGAHSWIIAEEGGCIVIDPADALCQRIADMTYASRSSVRAIVLTQPGPQAGAARDRLAQLCGAVLGECDADGWPLTSAPIELADGAIAGSIALSEHRLVRQQAGGASAYLLGSARRARLDGGAIRYAFGDAAADPAIAARIGGDTLLCCPRGDELPFARAAAASCDDTVSGLLQLDASALDRFLASHPGARLIDLREHYEFLAGPAPSCGIPVESVPLSQLASHLPGWLGADQRPLVLYCRSGARSARAARCLHRLGYLNAWQLSGGLALGGALLAA
ncbi:aminotransferase class V-fold PLP-dependent enzyme [Pseudoduganella sp. GCM10020061]|uniref:aminotransferase class V-fold PLP-dependent enzyme n=1 Tax=Pseudoduganella sp. GCM10020061 TaxID=3317345 RepID=UPI00362E942D